MNPGNCGHRLITILPSSRFAEYERVADVAVGAIDERR
jgi:hypothetical protein